MYAVQNGLEYFAKKIEENISDALGKVYFGREHFEEEDLPIWSLFSTNGDLFSQGMNSCILNDLVVIQLNAIFKPDDINNPLLSINSRLGEIVNLLKNLALNDNTLGGNIFELIISNDEVNSDWFSGSNETGDILTISIRFFFRILS